MSVNNYEEMKIESDVFQQARDNFNLYLQRLFDGMKKNNSSEGSITLKVDINMEMDFVSDGQGGTTEINKPVLKQKVAIAVPLKDHIDSKKDTGMNLVWDEELRRFVLRYINEGGQKTLFDPDYEENLHGENSDPDESAMLPGPTNALPDNGGAIDADFTEVNEQDEENTEPTEKEAPGSDTEASDSTGDNDYEYDDLDNPEGEGNEE